MPNPRMAASSKLEGEQLDARLVAVGRFADDADEVIHVGQRDQVAVEHLGALLGGAQLELRAAQDDDRGGAR